jgi:hypothetical protein
MRQIVNAASYSAKVLKDPKLEPFEYGGMIYHSGKLEEGAGHLRIMDGHLFQSSALQMLAIASKALDVFIQTQGIIGSVTIFNSQASKEKRIQISRFL